jgi:hypothetical protein
VKAFEKRVLRRIFGPKREEVAGGWRRLHNEELRNLNLSLNIILVVKSKTMRGARHVASMGERNTYNIVVGKPEGKRPLGRPSRRCDDNIRMDLRETGWEVLDWMNLTYVRVHWRVIINAVMNLRVPLKTESFLTIRETISFSKMTLLHAVS